MKRTSNLLTALFCTFSIFSLTNCAGMPNLAELQSLAQGADDDDDDDVSFESSDVTQESGQKTARKSSKKGKKSGSTFVQSTEVTQEADSQTIQKGFHKGKKKESPKKGASASTESTPECKAAIDNLFRIEPKEDGEPYDEAALAKVRQSDDYLSDLDECTRLYPPSLVKCITQAKSEKQLETCEKKAESRPAEDRPSDEDCQKAIDNMIYYEFKDDMGAKAAKQMVTKFRSSFEYKEAYKECKEELNVTAVRCMINAKSEDEIDACTD